MHPEVTSDKPGTCPKCGMKLVDEERLKRINKHMETPEHDHMAEMLNPTAAADFLRRFWAVTVLLVPLFIFNKIYPQKYIELFFATAIFYFGLVFFKHAAMEIKMRQPGMMTLVSLGVGSGYVFSAVSTFVPSLNTEFYLEISTLIWILLFGHYLEAKSSTAAGDALSEVEKLLPKTAHIKKGKSFVDTDARTLKVGDIVLVKPGEKVPADGKIVDGGGNFDESLITGESVPVEKGLGLPVSAGSIILDGSVEVEITGVGESSTVGQIKKLIERAAATKPRAQRIADRASGWLTAGAVFASTASIIYWLAIAHQPISFALTLAITVLVIACPHALGLAIPTVSTIAMRLAVKNGIFLKDMAKIETVKNADCVVFDKTGTLTTGKISVEKIMPAKGVTNRQVLHYAAAVEQYSAHPIAEAIVSEAKRKKIKIAEAKNFKSVSGQGVKGTVEGNKIEIKKPGVRVFRNGKLIGEIKTADSIRPESKRAVDRLHNLGIKVAMLTGDKKEVASVVSSSLGIDTVYSEVLPEEKYKYIGKLQSNGNTVIMAGDGVNDAPALAQSDVGVAIGSGTDVAVEAGDVILTGGDPEALAKMIVLSRKVYRKMVENLAWAAGYNIVAIPAAAGAFLPLGFSLSPATGAILMSLSSVIVVVNALNLLRIKL